MYKIYMQQNVGLRLWGASVVLTDYILNNSEIFAGQTILEIGAGMGLCSLCLAAPSVLANRGSLIIVQSDFNSMVLENAKFNVDLNGLQVSVQRMDWDCACYTSQGADARSKGNSTLL